ncbi:MAG: energy transducer TonB [Thermoanaerobaculales bacterium]|jgi:protein TonB|nr:energy transducer TonB [Thermoanaerobaculales bacterium]
MTETPKTASKAPEPQLKPTVIEIIAAEERQDKKLTRIAMVVAVVVHVFIFAFHWPTFAGGLKDATEKKTKIYVVKQVKFQQPPQQELQQIPKPKSKKVPIPDPTPDEPEPIRDEEPDEDIEFIPDDNLVLGIPDAPPPPEPEGPVRFVVGGNITEPVKLSGPNPVYPEAARRARIQGVVVLECTIGKDGTVREVKVLRPLPLGLTEAAIDAVTKWKFEPSTLNGKPVEVLYILTVRFNLQ